MRNVTSHKRPLSPHLTVYRPQKTSVLSIFHRLTGIGLVFPTLTMVIWVISISLGPFYFNFVTLVLGSLIGKIFLTVSLWALLYHTLTGIRHLIWDMGFGVNIKWVDLSSWFIVLGSFGASSVIVALGAN